MSRRAGRSLFHCLARLRHPAALLAAMGGACCVSLAQTPADAGAPSGTPWQVEVGAGADHLSGGTAGWRQVDLALRHRFAPRSLVELAVRGARRGGADDIELAGLLTLPLGGIWQGTLVASASPSHEALPRHVARLELARSFDGGWVASVHLARRRFEVGPVDSAITQVGVAMERYVGAWRGAVAVGSTRLGGGGHAANLRLQLDRSFAAERGRIGLIVARGRELEGVPATLAAPSDVIEQQVRTLALVGTLPLADRWALTGEASHVRNSDLRRRSGLPAGAPVQRSGARLGVRFDF